MNNRVAQYFSSPDNGLPVSKSESRAPDHTQRPSCKSCNCSKCRTRSKIAAGRQAAKEIENCLQELGSFEVWHDRKKREVFAKLFLHAANIKLVPADTNLAQYTINELRRLATEMLAAADRLEWMDA